MNDQRKVIFEQRKELLKSNNVSEIINSFLGDIVKNLSNKKEMYMHFESDEVTIDFFKKIIEDYFDDIISKYKVKNLALKSLLFGSCIDILLKMFSFLNPIFIIRDPRDIISSLLEISKKQIESNIKPNYPNNISLLCNFINDHYKLSDMDNLYLKLHVILI